MIRPLPPRPPVASQLFCGCNRRHRRALAQISMEFNGLDWEYTISARENHYYLDHHRRHAAHQQAHARATTRKWLTLGQQMRELATDPQAPRE